MEAGERDDEQWDALKLLYAAHCFCEEEEEKRNSQFARRAARSCDCYGGRRGDGLVTMERAVWVCCRRGSGSREMWTHSGMVTVPPSRSAMITSNWGGGGEPQPRTPRQRSSSS